MPNIYLAKQPIVNTKNEIYGYELLFRNLASDGSLKALVKDELLATTKVLSNALNHFGMTSLVDDNLAFINVDQEFLMDPIVYTIPKDRFILEILEDTPINERIINRISKLKDLGYRFALDDLDCSMESMKKFAPIFHFLDIVKLDVTLIDFNCIEKYIPIFKEAKFKLLAEKVETKEEYEKYKSIGCSLFQGYFFAKPDLLQKESLDPAYKKIFQLINLLDDEYTEISEIVKELETEIELTIQLLRFINSSYIGLRKEVKSISHVVMLLGKKPLKQWLLLVAFSKSLEKDVSIRKNPIIELALNRSKIMGELAKIAKDRSYDYHEASFVGMLSLVDAILRVSIEDILKEINVDYEVKKALLEREGALGKLLELVISIEKFDMPKTDKILDELKLTNLQLSDVLQKSYIK